MAKSHTLKPGDGVTLNVEAMATSLRQYCREKGIVDQVGTVTTVQGQRVRVGWAAQGFTGCFDADALAAEVLQEGLFVD